MKANEFRIGNWVSNGEVEFQLTSKDIYLLDVYVNRVIAKPIPITPQWLERFGFTITNHGWFANAIKNNIKFDISCISEEGITLMGYNGDRIVVKYIHQLQNIVFALTGEELEYRSNN